MKKILFILIICIISIPAFAVVGDISVEGRVDVTGNISAANFFGNGSNLTSLGVLIGITIETTASVSPYTVPNGVTDIEVILIGGGGAGGGANAAAALTPAAVGGGGGGGACTIKRIQTSAGTTYTFVVGAGGTGVSAAAGNGGGQTQFNTAAITANGGSGGALMASGTTILTAAGGAGGAAGATGDINIPGGAGGIGYRMSGTLGISGFGGASLFGSRTDSVYVPVSLGTVGIAGANYGSGGSGSASQRTAGGPFPSTGGAGAGGVIIIREFK